MSPFDGSLYRPWPPPSEGSDPTDGEGPFNAIDPLTELRLLSRAWAIERREGFRWRTRSVILDIALQGLPRPGTPMVQVTGINRETGEPLTWMTPSGGNTRRLLSGDPHLKAAQAIFGRDWDDLSPKERRQVGKTVNFNALYGGPLKKNRRHAKAN